uniref:AlNc14C316G10530 protein n=1 Tax=Albugo laibachii Nc14 TaxID=890382 RepID=F0WW92_9STRA|nr:AlNc14C316G10530 [Albugo laibachii Nc14]|eukprot:CCA25712.1 AlNc14C316G10530 [Albugo laibachii Nc14]
MVQHKRMLAVAFILTTSCGKLTTSHEVAGTIANDTQSGESEDGNASTQNTKTRQSYDAESSEAKSMDPSEDRTTWKSASSNTGSRSLLRNMDKPGSNTRKSGDMRATTKRHERPTPDPTRQLSGYFRKGYSTLKKIPEDDSEVPVTGYDYSTRNAIEEPSSSSRGNGKEIDRKSKNINKGIRDRNAGTSEAGGSNMDPGRAKNTNDDVEGFVDVGGGKRVSLAEYKKKFQHIRHSPGIPVSDPPSQRQPTFLKEIPKVKSTAAASTLKKRKKGVTLGGKYYDVPDEGKRGFMNFFNRD